MISCPMCQSALEEKLDLCPSCNAKKGYLKVNNFILGKNSLILLGFVVPLMIMLFAITAQSLFGLSVSISMAVPILFTIWRLILGAKWYQ